MKVKYVSILVIVLVLTSGIPLISGGAMNFTDARYATNAQSQANDNDCDTASNCAITSPQTQGDGTANSPTNLQISGFGEEEQEQGRTVHVFELQNCMNDIEDPDFFVCDIDDPTYDKFECLEPDREVCLLITIIEEEEGTIELIDIADCRIEESRGRLLAFCILRGEENLP